MVLGSRLWNLRHLQSVASLLRLYKYSLQIRARLLKPIDRPHLAFQKLMLTIEDYRHSIHIDEARTGILSTYMTSVRDTIQVCWQDDCLDIFANQRDFQLIQ